MRFLRAMAVASLAAGLLIAGAGCTNTVAAAPSTAHHTTSSTAPVATASATLQRTTAAAAPSTSSTATASTPFPGIWDITSWQAYRTAQASVTQGHQPWLLDPESVVSAWAHRWTPVPTVHQVAADTFQVTEPGAHTVYTIKGTRPDPDSATPIWVITSITHT